MTEKVKVPAGLAVKAWENWLDTHFGLDCDELADRFYRFADGGKIDHENSYDPWEGYEECDSDDQPYLVKPDCLQRLQQLAGPHHYAVIRAWYAKNPWKG